MPIKSLTNKKIPERKANTAFPKCAEDTESKLLEDTQEMHLLVKTAPANTAENGFLSRSQP